MHLNGCLLVLCIQGVCVLKGSVVILLITQKQHLSKGLDIQNQYCAEHLSVTANINRPRVIPVLGRI